LRASPRIRRSASPRSGRAFAAAIAILLVAGRMPVPAQSAPAAAAKAAAAPAAILLKGAIAERGLPFFGPNAIRALYGEYLLGERAQDAASAVGAAESAPGKDDPRLVRLWYTRESVVLSSAWKASSAYGAGSRVLDRPEGPAVHLKGEGYSLFLELRSESPEARSFAPALNRKFAVFFRNASSDAELSFPSTVEY
jgi:hypothetical protein